MAPQSLQDFNSVLPGAYSNGGGTSNPTALTTAGINSLGTGQAILNQASQGSQPPINNAPVSAPQNKGSWWERLLPTVGGIAGGIGGGLLGGAADVMSLGALTPFINPITMGVLGAGIGGGAGRMGENALTGQKVLQGNDLVSAGENAGGQLAGEGIGMGLSKLLGAGANVASGSVADAIMGQAPGYIDRPTAQYLADNGITNLSKVKDIAPLITGQSGGEGAAFTNGVEGAVNNSADKISIQKAMSTVQDPMSLSTMTDTTNKNAAKAIQKSIDNMVTNSGGTITNLSKTAAKPLSDMAGIYEHGQMNNISRGAAYDEAKTFLKSANQILSKAPKDVLTGNISDPQQAALYNVFSQWGHSLESGALGLGETDTPLTITAADKTALQNGIQSLQKSNPALYKTLSDQIDGATTWKDIKSAQYPLVKASQAADAMTSKFNSMPRTTPADVASQGKSGILKGILGSPTTKKVEAFGLNKIGGLKNSQIVNDVIPLLARTGAVGAANVAGGGLAPTPVNTGTPNGGTTGMPIDNNQNNNIGGTTNMESPIMQELRQALGNPSMASVLPSIVSAAQKQIAVQNMINQSLNLYGQAGGAQGGMGGLLTRLSALAPGSAAGQYQRSQGALSSSLANLLGMSPTNAAALMPTFSQNPSTANTNMNTLRNIFNYTNAGVPTNY